MKQIIMDGAGKSSVKEVPMPEINDDQLLVRVKYTGLCHSEWYDWSTAEAGRTFGHEPMGYVEKVGKNVSGFRVGDRVTGLGGGFAEYIVMNPALTVHVPDAVCDEDAVAEPLSCMLSAASKMLPDVPGDSIAVVGCGYMGCGMITLFKLLGYDRIVGVDPRKEARENALKYGATEVWAPDELPDEYIVNWRTMGEDNLSSQEAKPIDIFKSGFGKVMEFSGTESGLRLAGDMVCAHGRLGIGGYHNDCFRSIDFKLWNFKAFTAVNCHERRVDFQTDLCRRAMQMLEDGRWAAIKGAVTNIYPMEQFDEANRAMDTHPNGFVKALIRCSE